MRTRSRAGSRTRRATQQVLRAPPADLSGRAGSYGFSPYAFFAYFCRVNPLDTARRPRRRTSSSSARSSSHATDEPDIQSSRARILLLFRPLLGDAAVARSHAADAVRIAEALVALSRTFAYRGLGYLALHERRGSRWRPLENALKIARESRVLSYGSSRAARGPRRGVRRARARG